MRLLGFFTLVVMTHHLRPNAKAGFVFVVVVRDHAVTMFVSKLFAFLQTQVKFIIRVLGHVFLLGLDFLDSLVRLLLLLSYCGLLLGSMLFGGGENPSFSPW